MKAKFLILWLEDLFYHSVEAKYKQFESAIREQSVGSNVPAMAFLLGIPEGHHHVEDALDVGKSMDDVLAIETSKRNLLQVKHGREGEYVDNRCIFNFNIDNLMDFHDPDKTLVRREVISKVMQFVLGLYFKQTPPSMTVSLTVAPFFKFVTPFHVAYVWSLLIQQSIKNRSSGCQNHAGEIQLMDKCSTYLTHWSNCERAHIGQSVKGYKITQKSLKLLSHSQKPPKQMDERSAVQQRIIVACRNGGRHNMRIRKMNFRPLRPMTQNFEDSILILRMHL